VYFWADDIVAGVPEIEQSAGARERPAGRLGLTTQLLNIPVFVGVSVDMTLLTGNKRSVSGYVTDGGTTAATWELTDANSLALRLLADWSVLTVEVAVSVELFRGKTNQATKPQE
jgi:hypothetical protein